jgi:hypothetical protein
VQVVKLVREMGLVKPGAVAIDGTKANASRHKAMSNSAVPQNPGLTFPRKTHTGQN